MSKNSIIVLNLDEANIVSGGCADVADILIALGAMNTATAHLLIITVGVIATCTIAVTRLAISKGVTLEFKKFRVVIPPRQMQFYQQVGETK